MTTITFAYPFEDIEDLSILSLGDMTIVGNPGTVTSKGHTPSKSFMLLPSVSVMLSELAVFAADKQARTYSFDSAIGSSFRFFLERRKNGLHVFAADGTLIAMGNEACFFAAFKDGIDRFLVDYEGTIHREAGHASGMSELFDEFAKDYQKFCTAISALAIPVRLAIR